MINSVRNTVLSVLNKNNYGYISPSDFNLYAKQAQLEIFEDYFSEYNKVLNKENARMSGTDYADTKKTLEEAMEYFAVTDYLIPTTIIASLAQAKFYLPQSIYNGNDYYMINKIICYPVMLVEAFASAPFVPFQLNDGGVDFVLKGVKVGDIVVNTTSFTSARVLSVSTNTLGLSADIFPAGAQAFVYSPSVLREAEKVTHGKATMLNNSLLTSPTTNFPAYTQENDIASIFPSSLYRYGQIQANYFRYPFDPKWTYVTLLNGEPSFDQTQPDYMDFELPIEDETRLIMKILQYCGISIREGEVYQFAKTEENQDNAQ